MDRIIEHTETWAPCHGIVHWYQSLGFAKGWRLFGRKVGLTLRFDENQPPKRGMWVLRDSLNTPIQSWRRLPSRFLRQLRPYQIGKSHTRKPNKRHVNWRPFRSVSKPAWEITKVVSCCLAGLRGRRLISPNEPGTVVYMTATVLVSKPPKPKVVDPTKPRHLLLVDTTEDNYSNIIIDVDNDRWSYVQGDRAVNLPPRYDFTIKDRDKIFDKAKEYVNQLFE